MRIKKNSFVLHNQTDLHRFVVFHICELDAKVIIVAVGIVHAANNITEAANPNHVQVTALYSNPFRVTLGIGHKAGFWI